MLATRAYGTAANMRRRGPHVKVSYEFNVKKCEEEAASRKRTCRTEAIGASRPKYVRMVWRHGRVFLKCPHCEHPFGSPRFGVLVVPRGVRYCRERLRRSVSRRVVPLTPTSERFHASSNPWPLRSTRRHSTHEAVACRRFQRPNRFVQLRHTRFDFARDRISAMLLELQPEHASCPQSCVGPCSAHAACTWLARESRDRDTLSRDGSWHRSEALSGNQRPIAVSESRPWRCVGGLRRFLIARTQAMQSPDPNVLDHALSGV